MTFPRAAKGNWRNFDNDKPKMTFSPPVPGTTCNEPGLLSCQPFNDISVPLPPAGGEKFEFTGWRSTAASRPTAQLRTIDSSENVHMLPAQEYSEPHDCQTKGFASHFQSSEQLVSTMTYEIHCEASLSNRSWADRSNVPNMQKSWRYAHPGKLPGFVDIVQT